MIHFDKDPTLDTLARQETYKSRGLYTGELDNWDGARTEDAREAYQLLIRGQLPQVTPNPLANRYRDIWSFGIDLIKHFEAGGDDIEKSGYLKAYQDEVGVWTIGWGHTGLKHKDGTVFKGRTITRQQAEDLLRYDMDVFEGRVTKFISVPLTDWQYAALVSFDFNTGGLGDSTMRRLVNAGNFSAAAEQFARWNKAGGRVLAGLTRRRASERRMFLNQTPYIVQ